jgi:beta-galactosidase
MLSGMKLRWAGPTPILHDNGLMPEGRRRAAPGRRGVSSLWRRFPALGGLIWLLAGALRAGVPGDGIAVGVVYNVFNEDYPTDQAFFDQVDRDIPAIAAAHFRYVMVFPLGQWDPATRALRWTRTDYLVRRIEASGLKFVPLLLKEEQCAYYLPMWRLRELGLWAERNRNNGNPANRDNIDFTDPRVWPELEAYFRAVITRYRDSPALAFYNVWNEPHFDAASPAVISRFREWLRRKYGTLPAFSRAWGEPYADWSDASPFVTSDWASSMPAIDWALFRNQLDGELLGQVAALARRFDPRHPLNANPVGTPFALFAPFGGYNTDNWQFTPYDDFNGVSYYPDAWARDHGYSRAPVWFHNLSFDVFRSAAGSKDYILTELYTGTRSGLTLGGYLDAPTARQLAWIALANNCKGMIYWKWEPFRRGRQSLGRGLADFSGRLTPRGEAVSAFAAAAAANGPLLREARLIPPQVGVIVDMAGLLKVLQEADVRTRTFMYRDIAGTVRALDEANIPVDLLRADLGLDDAALSRYRVLILPFQIVMRPDLAARLSAYVRNGGCLIADARTATLDALDHAFGRSPGAGLAGVFGATCRSWTAEPASYLVYARIPGLWSGSFSAVDFREQLALGPGATPVARFADSGQAALIRHRWGRGTAWLAAVPLGAGPAETSPSPAAAMLVALCRAGGAVPPADFVADNQGGGRAMVRVHRRGAERVVYVINPGDATLAGRVSLAASEDLAQAMATDLITGQTVGPELRLALPPQGVAVLWLRPAAPYQKK